MKKLEDVGIVKGYYLVVDFSKLGYDIFVFLGIYFDKSLFYEDVAREFVKILEVVVVYYIIGLYFIFVIIVCWDIKYLWDVFYDKV